MMRSKIGSLVLLKEVEAGEIVVNLKCFIMMLIIATYPLAPWGLNLIFMIRRTFSYHYKPSFVVNLYRKKYILLLVAMTTFYLSLIFFSMQNLFSCRSHSLECGVCIHDIFNTCFSDLTEGVNI